MPQISALAPSLKEIILAGSDLWVGNVDMPLNWISLLCAKDSMGKGTRSGTHKYLGNFGLVFYEESPVIYCSSRTAPNTC